jgi:hypothetical protein
MIRQSICLYFALPIREAQTSRKTHCLRAARDLDFIPGKRDESAKFLDRRSARSGGGTYQLHSGLSHHLGLDREAGRHLVGDPCNWAAVVAGSSSFRHRNVILVARDAIFRLDAGGICARSDGVPRAAERLSLRHRLSFGLAPHIR